MLKINQLNFNFDVKVFENKVFNLKENLQKKAMNPFWLNWILSFFNSEACQLAALGAECCALLDRIETMPVIFSENFCKTEEQKKNYESCIKTAKVAISLLSSSDSSKVKTSLEKLIYRVIALQYRIEGVNGGQDKSTKNPILIEKLCKAVTEWKNQEPLIENKLLRPTDIKIIEQVSTYPEFVELLLTSTSLKETFFNWALRDGNPIDHFIQYPAIAARLKSCYLSSRVGKLGMYLIRKRETANEVHEKVMTLPLYRHGKKAEFISIMDESLEIDVHNRLGNIQRMTIQNVLKVFGDKNKEIGELEIFRDGIMLWNSHKVGGIDLTLDEWWKQLPVLEEVSHKKMEELACGEVKTGEWVVFAKASRTTVDMDLANRHGYIEVAIPQENGNYLICPFGIFPLTFPNTLSDLLFFLGNTARAKIAFPDENFFYSHRQQASYPITLSAADAAKFMKNLQKELINAKHGHKIFQFGAENCAYWSQFVLSKIESMKCNLYKTPYLESYPLNPILKRIFNFFRSVPSFVQSQTIGAVDIIFGSMRGVWVFEDGEKIFKSHQISPVRNEFVIFQPGHLHRQIQKGQIKGHINLGNC